MIALPSTAATPHDPILGVAKSASAARDNGDGSFDFDVTVTLENLGAVWLADLQVQDDLRPVFPPGVAFEVSNVSSPDGLAVNAGYDGATDRNLLKGDEALPIGRSARVSFALRIRPNGAPGPFLNSAVGSARDSGGTQTTDESQRGDDPDPNGDGDPSENEATPIVLPAPQPVLGVAKEFDNLFQNPDGTFNVTVGISLENFGPVPIDRLRVTDDLRQTFGPTPGFRIRFVSSSDGLAVNRAFDGENDTELLLGTDSLAVGDFRRLFFGIVITPNGESGPFENTAIGFGRAGTKTTTDRSQDGKDPDPNRDGNPMEMDPSVLVLPKNPRIGLALAAGTPSAEGGGNFRVPITMTIENLGPTRLEQLDLLNDLRAVFGPNISFSVENLSSADGLGLNGGFDGDDDGGANPGDLRVLAPGNGLALGATTRLSFDVIFAPGNEAGPFLDTATVSGRSPDGTLTTDISTDGFDPDPNGDGVPDEQVPTPISLVNRGPTARDDSASTPPGVAVSVPVIINDSDPDNDPLTIQSVTQPPNGSVTFDPNGTVAYTPNPGFLGTDTFTYTVCDPAPLCATATVTVAVSDQAPTAVADMGTTTPNTPIAIDVLDNDTDPQNQPLTVVATTDPANGTIVVAPDGTITYTPDPGFLGTDTFTYTIEDPDGNRDSAIVTINVVALIPDVADDVATTFVDTPVAIDVLANDSDPDGDPLSIRSVAVPANGTVAIDDGGTPGDPSDDRIVYTPNPGFRGVDVFTYTACDPSGNCDNASVTVSVLNRGPTARDDSASTPPGVAVSVPVIINDSDPDNDPLTIQSVTQPPNGSVTFDPNGTVAYTPNPGFLGTDTFTYTVCDPAPLCATATVTVAVSDQAPTAVADMGTTTPNTPIAIDVLDNDTDPQNQPLTVVATTDPANGTIVVAPDGTITYTPDPGFLGTDTFTYTIEDPDGNRDSAIVTINVVALIPDVADDVATTFVDTPVAIDVLANDSDPDGDPLSIRSVAVPANGTVAIDDGGTPGDPSDDRIVYTPNPGFRGVDVFTYTACDPSGNCDNASVTVSVLNRGPTARDDSASTPPGVAVSVPVIINDSDPDNDPLTIQSVTQPPNGSVTFDPNGTVAYTPNPGFLGTDTFTYTVCDPAPLCATATVTVAVSDQAPTAVADMGTTTPNTPIAIDVLDNDTDPQNQPLTVVATTDPANGTIVVAPDGTITYTPDPGFLGTDTFTYTIEDPDGNRDSAIVTVLVASQIPNAADDVAATPVNTPVAIDVLANDSDPDGDPLSILNVAVPANGSVAIDDGGTPGDPSDDRIVYTPNPGFFGVDVFTYTACDPGGKCDTADVTVTVTAPGGLSGTVFIDINHDDEQEDGEPGQPDWTIEVLDAAGNLVATTRTTPDSETGAQYAFADIPAGTYRLLFRHPTSNIVWGIRQNVAVLPGQVLPRQNFPVDPSGVVYDAISRAAVAGALAVLTDASGTPLPVGCFLHPSQQNQTTGADGRYRFDVVAGSAPACPTGETEYRIQITEPAGYLPVPSALLPPEPGALDATSCPGDPNPANNKCEIGSTFDQPAPGQAVRYFLAFLIASGDRDVVDNHIALDPTAAIGPPLRLSKIASKGEVSIGDVLAYSIVLANGQALPLANVVVTDTPPAGFDFADGSAQLLRDGQPAQALTTSGVSPVVFEAFDIAAGETVRITYLVRVGGGLSSGRYVNTAIARSGGITVGNTAQASVEVVSDPVFEQTTAIGKVFHDRDGDGWQDSALASDVTLTLDAPDAGPFHTSMLAAYIPGSTRIDRGQGPEPLADVDGTSPVFSGLNVGSLHGRRSHEPSSVVVTLDLADTIGRDLALPTVALRSDEGWRSYLMPDGRLVTKHKTVVEAGMSAQQLEVRSALSSGDGSGRALTIRVENRGLSEDGIPGVRIATVGGLLIETDTYGRYHLADIDGGDFRRGRNFILKVDPSTLPVGTIFTTENPRVVRVTQGLMSKLNFGVQLPESQMRGRLRARLSAVVFEAGSDQIRSEHRATLDQLVDAVRKHACGDIAIEVPRRADARQRALAARRAAAVRQYLADRLDPEVFSEVEVELTPTDDTAGPWEPEPSETPEVGSAPAHDAPLEPQASLSPALRSSGPGSRELLSSELRSRFAALAAHADSALAALANWIVPAAHADASSGGHAACEAAACGDRPGYSVDVAESDAALTTPALVLSTDDLSELPTGGAIWATQDPAVFEPRLDVKARDPVVLDGELLFEPVEFHVYTNYASFIERWELLIYRSDDSDRVAPVRTLSGKRLVFSEPVLWRGKLDQGGLARRGDTFQYVLRAYDAEGHVDETRPRSLSFVGKDGLFVEGPVAYGDGPGGAPGPERIYGNSNLSVQTIPVRGSTVRIHGSGLVPGSAITVDGEVFPVDPKGRFAVERLLPLGNHSLVVHGRTPGGAIAWERQLDVEVDGNYMFLVGIADLTLAGGDLDGSIEPVAADEHFDDSFFANGRLAFYLKGKIRGKYLITAHLDTTEDRLDEIWGDLDQRDPRTIFRRLDPDRFYPVYGDDSTVVSDVDTSGRFYVRIEADASQLLWGNYDTGITGNEFAEYNRTLYGAQALLRSEQVTEYGERRAELNTFVALPDTLFGHNEFLGTGGSLYYLRDQDVAQGSEKVWIEVRERDTARVVRRVTLERGRDYEMDEIQGRLILSRPLHQVARQAAPSIVQDSPLEGNDAFLLVDYEYLPRTIDPNDLSFGSRGKVWATDQIGIGGTYVQDRRDAQDYQLWGADLTLRAGKGSYVKGEFARSDSNQASTGVLSLDGGLSFRGLNPTRNATRRSRTGDAISIEARTDLTELGVADVEMAGWWRRRDAEFSTARNDIGVRALEYGGEAEWRATEELRLSARAAQVERGGVSEELSASLQGDLTIDEFAIGAEIRHVQEKLGTAPRERGLLGGLRLGWQATSWLGLYTEGQVDLDKSQGYEDNNRIAVGGEAKVTDRWDLHGEVSTGDRGQAVQVGADFRVNDVSELYASYTLSTDDRGLDRDGRDGIFTVGNRARISNNISVFNEHQFDHGEDRAGVANVFGLDYSPDDLWSAGFSVQSSEIDRGSGFADAYDIERHAVSAWLGFEGERVRWRTRLEWRRDQEAFDTTQWLSTNRMDFRFDPDWTLLLNGDFSRTTVTGGRKDGMFVESSLGLAYRPVLNDKLNMIGKYTFLYDLPTLGQVSVRTDERAHVVSLEGLYDVNKHLGLGSKYAYKYASVRAGRDQGDWFQSQTHLGVVRGTWHVIRHWDVLGEYRVLYVKETADIRHGPLVALYRHISSNFKVGVGYSFTDFNDELTRLDYENHGWFVNFLGKF